MYGILFAYIWLTLMVNVGKYTIHGSSGIELESTWLANQEGMEVQSIMTCQLMLVVHSITILG